MIEFTANDIDNWVLTKEGSEIVQFGSHEVKVFNAIPSNGGLSISEVNVIVPFPYL
jgi:hypothetical protein